jgi:hypothetical protein
MSQALHDVIPVMGLPQEMREQDFKVLCTEPYVYCKVFEDNSGALELARLPKLCLRTKHINVCYHHFCEHVRKGLIKGFPLTPRIRLLTLLPSPWHKMIFNVIVASCAASDLHKLPN